MALAWGLGIVFSRFGLPVMLGELLAGVILGPHLLGLIEATPSLNVLAELGIFFVMFHTGMEMDPQELLEHIWPALTVAIGGFILPFIMGIITAFMFGSTLYQSILIGLGISITAIAVQTVILKSMRINQHELGHIIIGAAIANDILALVTLSILLGLVRTSQIQLIPMLLIFVKVIAFFGFTIIIGHFIMPRLTKKVTDEDGKAITFALIIALLMGYLAELAGLHIIVGAFLAGQFVRKEIMDQKVYESISHSFFTLSYGFLMPIFFASLSLHLHFSWDWSFICFCLVITLVAITGKVIGCGLGATLFKYNRWESAIIGFGMNGRGAVELVIATVVLNLSDELIQTKLIDSPLLTQEQFSALVLMAFVTTLMAPLILKLVINRT